MTRRSRILAAAVLGLAMTRPAVGRAADPAGLPALPSPTNPVVSAAAPATLTDHAVAAAAADALRQAGQAGQLRHYNIDVTVKDGTAELTGTVASPQQRDEVLRVVQGVSGVGQVVDKLTLLAPSAITQVQATGPAVPTLQPAAPVAPAPEFVAPPNAAGGIIPEPAPAFAVPAPSPYDLNPPLMPPYSWPTYAPYNNYSRVAYPLAYPYQSWPFIGPCYPFPKIPPGWRSVKLEWQDGHWWFSRVATKNDWWRLRFW